MRDRPAARDRAARSPGSGSRLLLGGAYTGIPRYIHRGFWGGRAVIRFGDANGAAETSQDTSSCAQFPSFEVGAWSGAHEDRHREKPNHRAPSTSAGLAYVGRLRTLRALGRVVLHLLAFREAAKSVRLDRRVVDEHVLAAGVRAS